MYKNYHSSSSTTIHPISGPRNVVIKRTGHAHDSGATGGGGGSHTTRVVEMTRSFGSNNLSSAPGASSNVVHNGVNNLMEGREKERQEMQNLNDRFANYIDKVKHLEDENRRLSEELAELKDQWCKETARIKAQYDGDMERLRNSLDQAEANKAELEMRANSVEDLIMEAQTELDDLNQAHVADKETIDKMMNQLSDYESEIQSLRRRLSSLEEEKVRDEKESAQLKENLNQVKKDLDRETLEHIKAQNEVQSLRDLIEFLKKIYESELKELAALAYKEDSKDFWKNEMAQALRDIQTEYDNKMEGIQSDMEAQYSLKIQEYRSNQSKETSESAQMREENSRLKEQLAQARSRLPELEARNAELERMLESLKREIEERNRQYDAEKASLRKELANKRAELEGILVELQILLDAKLSLELEITAYRKMLEGEEIRVNRKMASKNQGASGRGGMDSVDGMISKSSASNLNRGLESSEAMITRSSASQFHSAPSNKSSVTQVVKGEMSAKTSFQRTAKGNVTIQECSPEGKFIILENSGKDKEDVSGFQIQRNTDNGRLIVRYNIPSNTIIGNDIKNRQLKIWSRGNRPQGSNDLEISDSNWGVGSYIVTTLSNTKGDERATHTQRTVYQM